jgi:hypothetical protein
VCGNHATDRPTCKASYCQLHFCGDAACQKMLQEHEPKCILAAKRKKEQKKADKQQQQTKL